MSKLKSKLARRIMAIVLSGAMVMSNMSAYAAELAPKTAVEEVSEVAQLDTDDEGSSEKVTPAQEESTPAQEVLADDEPESSEAESSSDDNPESSEAESSSDDNPESSEAESSSDDEPESSEAESSSDDEPESSEAESSSSDDEPESSEVQDSLKAPENVKAALNETKDGVIVSWNPVNDADSYEVTAKEQGAGETADITKTVEAAKKEVTFNLTGEKSLTRGKSYKFSVVAKKGELSSAATEAKDIVEIPTSTENPSETVKHVLESNDLEKAAEGDLVKEVEGKTRNGEKSKDGYFTMWYAAKSKIDSNAKSWADYNNTLGDDGTIPAINRITFASKMDVQTSKVESAIEFTTQNPAKVTIWWVANFASTEGAAKYREIAIQKIGNDDQVTTVAQTHMGAYAVKNAPYKSTLRLSEAGKYYLGSLVGSNYIFKVEVEESETVEARKAWNGVGTPEVKAALKTTTSTDAEGNETVETDKSTIVVTVTNVVLDDNGGDALTVTMTKDGSTEPVTKTEAASKTEYTYEFQPTESGTYKFKAALSRLNADGEEEGGKKESNEASFDFTLPFSAPENLVAVDKSEGETAAVELSWNAVIGADSYVVIAKEKGAAADAQPVFKNENVTGTKVKIDTGLAREKTYIFSVQGSKANAVEGGAPQLTAPAEVELEISKALGGDVLEKKYILDIGTLYSDFTASTPQADRTMAIGAVKRTEDNFFTIYYRNEGTGQSRIDVDSSAKTFSDGTTATHCINTGAAVDVTIPSAAIKFEIPSGAANAKVKVYWRGGGDGSRKIGIKDKDNNVVSGCSVTSPETAKAGDAQSSEFTLSADGTYYLGSLEGANRFYRVEVTYSVESQVTTIERTFNAETDVADPQADGTDVIPAGTTYADGYFRTEGTVKPRSANETAGTAKRLEIAKNSTGAMLFTVLGTADVTIEVSSTGASNNSMAGIVEKSSPDTVITNTEGKRFVKGLEKTTLTYTNLPKGEYKIVSPKATDDDKTAANGDGMSRSMFLYTIKVTEKRTGDEEEKVRAEWPGTIAAPVIKSVALDETDKGKINVTVDALIDYYEGGDQVTVYMNKKDAAEGEEGVSAFSVAEKSEHIISFTPEASSTYVFRAELSRNDEEAKISAAETKELAFTLPLTKPHIKSATSKGRVTDTDSGSVELAWDEVKEATGYTIKYKEKDAADDTAVTVDIESDKFEHVIKTGLEIGKTYVFTLTAKRAGTGTDGADEISEVSDESLVEITEESQITWAFSVYGDSTSLKTNGYTDKTHVGQNNGKDMPLVELNQVDGKAESTENENDFVRVWSMSGAGKIVPASVDGIAFYYTKIDPNTTNFKLTATAHVNDWTLSNAQDGFGIMAADRVGTHGNSEKWWNNSYQALASKVEYRWNPDKAIPDYSGNTDYQRYSMKLGVGSTEKLGVTKENLPELENTDTVVSATTKYFKSDTKTLDVSTINLPSGTYNIIGNYTGGTPEGTQSALLVTDLKFTIELNATGYFLSYTPIYADGREGTTMTNKYYDRKALSHIEENAAYVGFFASRNADVTFKDITFETRDYDPTEEPEKRPVEKIVPAYSVASGTTANSKKYNLLFNANWPGKLTVKDSKGKTIVEPTTEKDENGNVRELNNVTVDENGVIDTFKSDTVELGIGVNTFQWTFTPDESYIYEPNPDYKDDGSTPSEPRSFTELSDFSTQTDTFTVTYKTYGNEGEALYVSPKGSALGTGTKANPLDIYTAVKYVQSGQTIYLMEGTYNLSKTVTVGRGISGTVDTEYETDEAGNILYDGYDFKKLKSYEVKEYIYMLPEPGAKTRPVLDFGRVCEGLVVAGDAWYIKGIDVTRSQLSKDGMRVCGSYCVVEDVHTYNNGNTGLQISRFGSDSKDYWPSYNLILNCTSYLNADQGFEDADGFAAKLTIGQGNVFDGCIAAYNADDGWDLFAKVESGNIGKVVIKNSIAYRNGYVLVKDPNGDGTITNAEARDAHRVLALDGIEYPAGNGNGFKMGGSNLPGGHTLYNSAAFYNAAKGIDSNSCVDIKAYNSISFNNEAYNVAFYGVATNTNFASAGLISYKTEEEYDVWDKLDDGTMVKNGTKIYAKEMKKGITYSPNKDQYEPSGNQDKTAVLNETTYLYQNEGDEKSTNSKSESVSADWFVKADNASFAEFDSAMKADMDYARVNGKINLHGFLELTDKVGTAAGEGNTGLGGAASDEKDKLKPIPENVPTTGGNVSSGDATEETTSGVRPEDMDQYIANLKKIEGSTLGLWFNIVDSQDVYYTGKAVKPEIHVYDDTILLTKKDYSVTYKNNVNAYVGANTCAGSHNTELETAYNNIDEKKRPTIIVKGSGNYIGMASELYFDIHPVDFANSPADPSKPYIVARDLAVETGKTGKVTPVVTYNGKKLSKGKDFEDITETPTGSTTITLKAVAGGNFTGTTTFEYKVVEKDKLAKNFKISKIPDQQRKGYNNYNVKDPIPVTLDSVLDTTVTVEAAGNSLTFGKDYTVIYENNVEVGTATAIFVGQGEYAGTKEVKFRIVASDLNLLIKDGSLKIYEGNNEITDDKKLNDETYRGAAIRKKSISIKNGNDTLELDKDYTLTYKNNNKAGNASIVIKGIGSYSGNVTKSFKIEPLDLGNLPSDVTIGGTFADGYKLTANFEKGGSKPNVELFVNGNRMIQGKDYSVSYQKNTAVGDEGIITLTGKGGLKGKLVKTFTIVKKNLADPDVVIMAEDVAVSAAGKEFAISPKIIIQDANGKNLSAGSDYDKDSITYEKVSGNGELKTEGKKTTVSIEDENDVVTIKATVKAFTSDNAAKFAKCGYEGEISTTFRVGYSKQSIKSARVTVNYKNIKEEGGKEKEYKYFDYTGQPIRLNQNGVRDDLEVYVGKDKLEYGIDYEIMTSPEYIDTYKNNIKKGSASVTIIGIGKYTGTKEVKYSIGARFFSWDEAAFQLSKAFQ